MVAVGDARPYNTALIVLEPEVAAAFARTCCTRLLPARTCTSQRPDRPDTLNALTPEMMNAAAEQVRKAGTDPGVRVILLTGAGRAFSAGADISGPAPNAVGVAMMDAISGLVRAIREVPLPVLAAVNGPAVGGGAGIALACDLVLDRESAYFLLPFAGIGLMPDGGATALLPATVGRMRAARMALLGERVTAAEALDRGLISHVAADAEFDAAVESLLARLAAGPTVAFARTKAAFNEAALPALEEALASGRRGQLELLAAADFAEGIRAFRAHRPPHFTDVGSWTE